MTCLDNIIGLSESTCECLEAGRPTDYNISRSGIFLDRLDGFNINMVDGSSDCQSGELWQRMSQAVEDAKLSYKNDLLGCVARFYKPRFNTFTGTLGQSTFKQSLNLNVDYAGVRITPAFIKGGFIYINKIGVLINQNAPVTVQVWSQVSDSEDAQLVFSNDTTPINAVINTLTFATLTTPLELPMWSESGHYIKYYVVMLLNGTFQPKNNKKDCGCSGSASKIKPYSAWMDFFGVYGDDILNPERFHQNGDSVINGIVLNIEAKCKVSEIICSEQYPLDFENDGNALNMAYAIRFRAGVQLFEQLQSSDLINRFTLLKGEHIANKIKEWSGIYQQYIEDTCKNTNRLFENDCLVCRDAQNTILRKPLIVTNGQNIRHSYI